MIQDPKKRKSIRWKQYDYTQSGAYFVTICTHEKQHLFGRIENGKMIVSRAGEIAQECWQEIPQHFPNVSVDEFVVMPNHIHGIIIIESIRANNHSPAFEIQNPVRANDYSPLRGTSKTLGSIVRGYKIGVTKWFRENTDVRTVWHRNYYDRVIRDDKELLGIREYIARNPQNWDTDEYHMKNFQYPISNF